MSSRWLVTMVALAALLGWVGAQNARAQETDARIPATVVISAAVPLIASATVGISAAVPALGGIGPWIANPLLLGTHIPLYWYDPGRAVRYTAAGVILPAAGVSLMMLGADRLSQEWSASILQAYSNLMLFSAYDVASHAGSITTAQPGGAAARLGPLISAPFTERIADPIVWIPSILGPTILTGWYLLFESGEAHSVGSTRTAYVGDLAVHPVVGGLYALAKSGIDLMAIATGEEAYYRGVLYDSLQERIGRGPARALDALLFPLVHLAGDLRSGFRPATVMFNFAWRGGMTLVFDAAYDKGGLPLAIATHYWSDLVLLMSRWWFYGG